ncbi:hypothetical protein MXB_2215 [Myxobolus squamalis]|nr:hypothetical protein MXB_2215 [Myxobolus squamalis]
MLHNACSHLEVGGYFIGIIPNSFEILRHFKKKGFGKISSNIFEIRMDAFENKLFGDIYHFKLDELVDCPEYMIYFPLLKEMLKKYDMRSIKWEPLTNFFLQNFNQNIKAMGFMKSLKTFTEFELSKIKQSATIGGLNYSHILDSLLKGRIKSPRNLLVASLSVEEWQVVKFYSVFVFKRDPPILDPLIDIPFLCTYFSNLNFSVYRPKENQISIIS